MPVSAAVIFRKVANEFVKVKVGERVVKMTQMEAMLRQVHTLALNNNQKASELMQRMRKIFPGSAPALPKYLVVVSDEDMLL